MKNLNRKSSVSRLGWGQNVLVCVWLLTLLAPAVSHAAPASKCVPEWKNVPTPSLWGHYPLFAVQAFTPEDVWAVGRADTDLGLFAFALHYDGSTWQHYNILDSWEDDRDLIDVSGIASNDLWAVGAYFDHLVGSERTLIVHWDGASWTHIPSPNVGSRGNRLYGVISIAQNDVWAVGEYFGIDGSHPLVLRWDGTAWNLFPVPNMRADPILRTYLAGITALSATNIWSVGVSAATIPRKTALTLNHTGNGWKRYPVENDAGFKRVGLYKVDASAPNNIWSIGSSYSEPDNFLPLVARWDGSNWSFVDAPANPKERYSDVAALSPENVWIVGRHNTLPPWGTNSVVLNWNGSSWDRVAIPRVGKPRGETPFINQLNGIDALSSQEIWSVGTFVDKNDRLQPLVLRYSPVTGKPAKTKLKLPARGTELTKPKATLRWFPTNCATRYEIVVNQDGLTGMTVEHDENLVRERLKTRPLESGHTYYWHVRACNADGCGKWSKWFNFSVE